MGLFDDERLTRLTISVTQAQRRKLGELAKRAGRGVTDGADCPRGAGRGLGVVSEAVDRERMADAKAPPGAVRVPR